MLRKTEFGTLHGETVYLFTLKNKRGVEVSLTNYGGIITSIKVPDRHGTQANVVLGFHRFEEYLRDRQYIGATVGRYANRIANGRFQLDGKIYQLSVNDGNHHLHGGSNGLDKVLWEAEPLDDNSVKLSYLSSDKEEGYPGNVKISVVFSLSDENQLKIQYRADTDAPTPINLTNHSYFNLTGDHTKGIQGHNVQIFADRYTPVDKEAIPTGEIEFVKNTPFDFTQLKSVEYAYHQHNGGFDHNFVLSETSHQIGLAAVVEEPEAGRSLKVYTDKPGMQFYTGINLDDSIVDSSGSPITKHSAMCLETQFFPDSPNHQEFPSPIVTPDSPYCYTTILQFDTH